MKILIFISLLFCCVSCQDNTPKPKGQNRVERILGSTLIYSSPFFTFDYSGAAYIDAMKNSESSDLWFNIIYPSYNATIYCTYLPITKSLLEGVLLDNDRLIYDHSKISNAYKETTYTNYDHRTFGVFYEFEGNVATPIQAFVTDSTSNFLRLSLYYNSKMSRDSSFFITEFIRDDMVKLIESLQWTK